VYAKQHETRGKITQKPKQKAFLTLLLPSLWAGPYVFFELGFFRSSIGDGYVCGFWDTMCGRLEVASVAPAFPVDRAPMFVLYIY